jgi:sugar phosphate isomerase/epimerase
MNHKPAIATVSMGWHPSHTFERKVQATQAAGFQGIELFITDLDRYADAHAVAKVEAAEATASLCQAAHLEILCLASLDEFDGEPTPLEGRLDAVRGWLMIAKAPVMITRMPLVLKMSW